MLRFVRTAAVLALVVGLFPAPALAEEAPPEPAEPVDIVILGGTGVVPPSVELHLRSCTLGAVTRIAGANRYATSAAISKKAFPSGASRAYLAVGTNYPDAIAAGAVAAKNASPLLLTAQDSIPGEIAAELRRLGVSEAIILGGEGAVSAAVANRLAADYAVTRISGANRYATSAAISSSAFGPPVDVAYIATGRNFPDALVGGPAAFAYDGPILLTDPTDLSPETMTELERLQPSRIVILGGTAVVSTVVEQSLATFAPVTRIAGRDRYATAAATTKSLPTDADTVYLTTGHNFPDALSATPLVGSNPMLLTSEGGLPPATSSAIASLTGQPCAPILKVSEFTTYHPAGQSPRDQHPSHC